MSRGTPVESWSQLRRCHRCFSVNESRGERVLKCQVCSAHFAPYFFAELTPGALANQTTGKVKPHSLVLSNVKAYRPVVGLTWWWHDGDLASGETIMTRA